MCLSALHAEHQPRDAIVLVGLNDALGEFDGLVDVAVDQERQEGAVEQFAVVRVAFERRPVIGRGGAGVALLAGMTGGEVAARRRRCCQVAAQLGACAASLTGAADENGGKRAAGNAAGEARKRHGLMLQ